MTSNTLYKETLTTAQHLQRTNADKMKKPNHFSIRKSLTHPNTDVKSLLLKIDQLEKKLNDTKLPVQEPVSAPVEEPRPVSAPVQSNPVGVFGDFDHSKHKEEEIIKNGVVVGKYKDALLVNGGVVFHGLKSIDEKPSASSKLRKMYIDSNTGQVVYLKKKKGLINKVKSII